MTDRITTEDIEAYADYTEGMKLHQETAWMPTWDADAYDPPYTLCDADKFVDHRREPTDWYPVLMEGCDE